jgi:hypothetical protein
MAKNGYERPNGSYIVYDLSHEEIFEQVDVNAMLNLALYMEIDSRKSQGQEISEDWLNRDWYGAPVFLTGQQINDYALALHRDSGKALVVVNIGDKDLSKLGKGYSASMFVAPRTLQAIKDFTSAGYIVYSNKTKHKIFKVEGDYAISLQNPNRYLERRYAEPLKELYPDRIERDKVEPNFHLVLDVDPTELDFGLSQGKINKAPERLSGYDPRVVEIEKLKEH